MMDYFSGILNNDINQSHPINNNRFILLKIKYLISIFKKLISLFSSTKYKQGCFRLFIFVNKTFGYAKTKNLD